MIEKRPNANPVVVLEDCEILNPKTTLTIKFTVEL
jgi:hypothetical protein